MNISQCTFCKKPFQSIGRRICPACLEQMDKDFIVVRDFIYDNKRTDIDTVAEETGVSKQVILHFLREGRLELGGGTDDGMGLLKCDVCKKPISSGKMCRPCMEKVASTMQKSVDGHSKTNSRSDDNFKSSAKLKN